MTAGTVTLNAGAGGDGVATDEIAGAEYQRVKLVDGTIDGTAAIASGNGTATNSLRVTVASDSTGVLSVDDNGGSLTVDGTVTANLSATDNAVLDTIETNTDFGAVVGGGVEATALRVTLANNSTGVLSIDDNGTTISIDDGAGSITVDGTVTANLSATDNAVLDSIDAAVNGTLTVGSHAVTNAGAFAVQVDGAALTALQLIDNIVQTEDAVHGTGDAGVMPLAVRNDALAALAGTDGDYAPLQVNASGALFIQEGAAMDVSAATVTVDNGGTFAVQVNGDALTALQLIDNIVQTEDAVHGSGDAGVMALGVRQDSQVDFGADGDYVPLSIDANGAVRVSGGGGGTEYTEDAAAAANPVGNAQILVRQDTPAGLVSADGDNVARRGTNFGAAFTQIVDSSGNFIDSFGGSGGTAAADDADFTATTTQGTPAMGVYESSPSSVTDGDMGIVGITQTRAMRVQIAGFDNSQTDDAAFTPATDAVSMIGCTFDDTTPDSVDEGDGGAVRMSANRNMYTTIRDAAGNERGMNVDANGRIGVTNGGTFAVQEDGAALTALQVIDNVVHVDDAAFTLGTSSGVMMMGFAGTQSVDANDAAALACDTDGALHIADGGNSITIDNADITTLAGAVAGSEMQVDVVGALPAGANTIGEVSIGAATTAAGDLAKAEDAAHASADVGVAALAVRRDAAAVGSGTDGDYSTLNVNEFGHLRTGCIAESFYRNIDANAEAAIKATPGVLHWIHVMNMTAAVAYVHLYNATTASVTPGTTTPNLTLPIATLGDTNGAGFNLRIDQLFDTAITIVVTTTNDGSTGDPGTNGVFVNAGYT